jgi:hypothetical protein
MGLLVQLEQVFPIVHHAADRRLCVRRNLHEIEALVERTAASFLGQHDSDLLTFCTDDSHFAGVDLLIAPGAFCGRDTLTLR